MTKIVSRATNSLIQIVHKCGETDLNSIFIALKKYFHLFIFFLLLDNYYKSFFNSHSNPLIMHKRFMKTKFISNTLSVACWNVHGLESRSHGMKCNKLDDPEVLKYLEGFDCIGLLETHADKAVDFTLPGYNVFRKDRVKHKNARTPSGGIAVLVKESMRHAYKFDPLSTSDIIWVRILKDYISMSNDLYVAFVYIPPLNSSFGKVHSKDIGKTDRILFL